MQQKVILYLLFISLTSVLNAQYQKNELTKNAFQNPVFSGDYPDPSILVDGKDYYMVHSSFEYYPGLLIWHSTDLINWTPVANALFKYVGSVWAPDLVKYEGKYYIYFPASGTNYVVSADNIAGPWSDPVELDVSMIDPGHVTDREGNRYLYFSSGSYVPLSKDGMSISGDIKHSYGGWEIPRDWSVECFCMEGPKLVKHEAYYYLTVAEGGTAGPPTGHMVISARSESPLGPWENSPYNPVLRAKTNDEKWGSVGHGTVFEDAEGKWWIVLHGYEHEHYNMGRQTLLLPIEWTPDGWYRIPDNISLESPVKKDVIHQPKTPFTLNDDFSEKKLKPHWKFFGEYDVSRFSFDKGIIIKGKGNSIPECSPLLCMPSDHSYTAEVEIVIENDAIAGLVVFYNKNAYSGILADSKNILTNIRGWQFETEKNVVNRHVFLRIKNVDNIVDMYYSTDGKSWNKTENSLEVSAFHHNVLGGFMSMRIGLCSIGNGKVRFRNFKYTRME
ncbi:family 43 glycosylhydrolase [Saccharicrinis sp. FJH54]|uniref:family 43 glycosylhydrolase n=1 Tax=Saccharicrinis sp. FJH54 TaxID=3344665 RepID=UPI0035D4730A